MSYPDPVMVLDDDVDGSSIASNGNGAHHLTESEERELTAEGAEATGYEGDGNQSSGKDMCGVQFRVCVRILTQWFFVYLRFFLSIFQIFKLCNDALNRGTSNKNFPGRFLADS